MSTIKQHLGVLEGIRSRFIGNNSNQLQLMTSSVFAEQAVLLCAVHLDELIKLVGGTELEPHWKAGFDRVDQLMADRRK